ncbi:hypothetical protein NL676_001646 [Syzygium grande]|nr:hypothetical protein NL676_001646 [Syzygium grande]
MHRYICASNILLNVHFEAMVGGFLLAMIMHERHIEEGTIERRTRMPRRGTGVCFSLPVGENSADYDSYQSYHRYEDVYVYTPICGTYGYIAPEYIYTGKCTLKNDVFAYGNVLLVLILGQSITELGDLADNENLSLEEWIGVFMNKIELGRVIDPNLKGNYVEKEAEQLVRLALLGAHEDPSVQPEMSEVVRMLESQFFPAGP